MWTESSTPPEDKGETSKFLSFRGFGFEISAKLPVPIKVEDFLMQKLTSEHGLN